MDHFSGYTSQILSELHSHAKSLFLYLKTVIEVNLSGTLDFSGLSKPDIVDAFSGREGKEELTGIQAYLERISEFPKFIRNNPVQVTDDMVELYMEVCSYTLLCYIIELYMEVCYMFVCVCNAET